MESSVQAHISPERLDAFIKGSCASEQAALVESHIDACEDCRVLLSTLVRGQRDAAADPTHQVALAPVTEGDVVAGKYKIERIIGAGGMGSVLAAWHLQLNQRVALKFMLPAIAADPNAAARFLREGRAAARMTTPHVGRVIDLDSLPNGTPYMVMEYLEGETLAQRLTRGALNVDAAVDTIKQTLIALTEAHALSIVHRDFKPANLFYARKPDGSEVVKVLDFGIAKSVHPDIEEGLATTSSRMLIGSPPYMAPEQITFQTIDARTDIWAVGVVLYEMLAGKVPFEGKTVGEVMFAIQNKAHLHLSSINPAVPPELSALVDRCLAKKPELRFADAAKLATAMQSVSLTSPALDLLPRAAWQEHALALSKQTVALSKRAAALWKSNPRAVLGGGAAAVLILGLTVWGLSSPAKSQIVHSSDASRVEQPVKRVEPPAPDPQTLAAEAVPEPAPIASPAKKPGRRKPAREAGSSKPAPSKAFEERR